MADKKSSLADAVGIEKRRLRSQSLQTLCKSRIDKAERFIFAGDLETGKTAVLSAISTLDKAAEKGILHPNNTARRKSRLMKKLNDALAMKAPSEEKKARKSAKVK